MGIIKRYSLLTDFRYSHITLFGGDVNEWVNWKSAKLAQEIYESRMSWSSELSDVEYRKLLSRVASLSKETAAKVKRKLKRIKHNLDEGGITIVSGNFGAGERECITFWTSDFIENLEKLIADKTFKILTRSIEEGEEIKAQRNQSVADFELTLERPIPTIYKDDLSMWADYYPDFIVNRISKMSLSREDSKWVAKEIISEHVNDILTEVERLDSVYVNIVDGSFRIGKSERCQIIPVADFISEFYKTVYNSVLKILDDSDL
jgi:hypothetical protein